MNYIPGTDLVQLKGVADIKKAKMKRKQLTVDNFEVLSVEPYVDSRGHFNAVAVVRIDTRKDTAVKCEDKRYITRRIPFARVDLREALEYFLIPFDSKGRYKVSSLELDAVIKDLNGEGVVIDPDEVTLMMSNETDAMLRAKADSLGFTGYVLLTTESDTSEEPQSETEGESVPPKEDDTPKEETDQSPAAE